MKSVRVGFRLGFRYFTHREIDLSKIERTAPAGFRALGYSCRGCWSCRETAWICAPASVPRRICLSQRRRLMSMLKSFWLSETCNWRSFQKPGAQKIPKKSMSYESYVELRIIFFLPSRHCSHLVTKRDRAALVGFDLRQVEGDVSVELLEEWDPITNQDRQDRITNFVG
jgi:hypothetical protein